MIVENVTELDPVHLTFRIKAAMLVEEALHLFLRNCKKKRLAIKQYCESDLYFYN